MLKLWHPFTRYIFRVEVLGLEKLGEGPYLIIANHNMGAPFEIMGFLNAWENRFSKQRPIYGLTHSFVFRLPIIRNLFWRLGSIPATMDAATEKLNEGNSVMIFPGGNFEAIRPFNQRNRCDFAGHKGWVKIALINQAPIVPVAITGSHLVNPVLWRSKVLSKILVVPWALGIKWFPFSISQIAYTPMVIFALDKLGTPFWLTAIFGYFTFLCSGIWPIWPAKIKISILEPISLTSLGLQTLSEEEKLDAIYQLVVNTIQKSLKK